MSELENSGSCSYWERPLEIPHPEQEQNSGNKEQLQNIRVLEIWNAIFKIKTQWEGQKRKKKKLLKCRENRQRHAFVREALRSLEA